MSGVVGLGYGGGGVAGVEIVNRHFRELMVGQRGQIRLMTLPAFGTIFTPNLFPTGAKVWPLWP